MVRASCLPAVTRSSSQTSVEPRRPLTRCARSRPRSSTGTSRLSPCDSNPRQDEAVLNRLRRQSVQTLDLSCPLLAGLSGLGGPSSLSCRSFSWTATPGVPADSWAVASSVAGGSAGTSHSITRDRVRVGGKVPGAASCAAVAGYVAAGSRSPGAEGGRRKAVWSTPVAARKSTSQPSNRASSNVLSLPQNCASPKYVFPAEKRT